MNPTAIAATMPFHGWLTSRPRPSTCCAGPGRNRYRPKRPGCSPRRNRKDPALRARWLSDLEGLAREFKLSREEYDAIRAQDPKRMMDLGVHQYYVPQILRLFFGAAHNSNASAALECYRRAFPAETAQAMDLQARLEGRRG